MAHYGPGASGVGVESMLESTRGRVIDWRQSGTQGRAPGQRSMLKATGEDDMVKTT